jgi:hypothetical protein
MQTLLAYAFGEPDAARVAAGLDRVEQHYQRYAGAPLDHGARDVDAVGLHLWEAAAEGRRWRAWQEDRSSSVATIHAPVRYESLVGDLPPERAAVPLADHLRARPEDVLRIGCPFVLATVDDAAELTLFTDAIGIGRLYQLRLPDGWVWSNRPLAPLLFAGLPARRDRRGWHFQRGTDSFMDGTSPFLDVTRVTEATRIQLDGRTGRCLATQIDPLRHWLSGGGACGGAQDPLHPQTVAAVAEELQDVARSAGRLWGQRPRLGLSGGRDSRLVAAAFLSAGVDVRFHTNDNPVGEADIARELLGRWPHPVEHHINHPPSAVLAFAPPPTGAIERALQWMRLTEGTQPASYLPRTPPAAWADLAKLNVSGVGGEIGHGGYHPRDVDVVETLPPEERIGAYLERLFLRLTVRGVSARTQETVRQRTEQVLARGIASGAAGVGVVDAFYMLERMPSFTGPGVREDTLVPLLSPGFVSAAVRQSPHQLREAALHRALVAHLIPAWQDVPFFPHFGAGPAPAPRPPSPPPDEGAVARGRSTWEIDPERERVAAILADSDAWAEDFDVEAVQAMWHRAIAGKASGPDQAAIQRVVWQVVFEDYLAELNGEPVRERAPIAVDDVPGAPPPPAPVVPAVPPDNRPHARAIRRLRRRLRRYPLARRVVRGVRGLRSGRS